MTEIFFAVKQGKQFGRVIFNIIYILSRAYIFFMACILLYNLNVSQFISILILIFKSDILLIIMYYIMFILLYIQSLLSSLFYTFLK